MESDGKCHRGVKPLLHSGEEYGNDLHDHCIPVHPRRSWAWAFSRLDNLGEMGMNSKLLLTSLIALSADMVPLAGRALTQTNGVPRLCKHPSEIEGDKKRAQRAEIAKWNAEWEARKMK
jgi:hypothetical protein